MRCLYEKLVLFTLTLLCVQSTWTMQGERINNARILIQRMLDPQGHSAAFNNPLITRDNQHLNTESNRRVIEDIAVRNCERLFTLKQRLNNAISDEQLNEIQNELQRQLDTEEFRIYGLEAGAQEFLRADFSLQEAGLCGMYNGKWVYDTAQENVLNAAITDQFLQQDGFTPEEIMDIRAIIHNGITIQSLQEIQNEIRNIQELEMIIEPIISPTTITDPSTDWITPIIIIAPIVALITYFWYKKFLQKNAHYNQSQRTRI